MVKINTTCIGKTGCKASLLVHHHQHHGQHHVVAALLVVASHHHHHDHRHHVVLLVVPSILVLVHHHHHNHHRGHVHSLEIERIKLYQCKSDTIFVKHRITQHEVGVLRKRKKEQNKSVKKYDLLTLFFQTHSQHITWPGNA